MKKRITELFLFTFVFLSSINAQELKMLSAGDVQIIDEINGIAISQNNKVVIGHLPPIDQREKQYQKVDLQKDDEILFVNGKKINSISDFKKYYTEIKTGSEVKFGIKRNNQPMIISFPKAEPSKRGKKIITITNDGEKSGANTKIEGNKVIINEKKIDIDSLKKSGAKVQIQKSK